MMRKVLVFLFLIISTYAYGQHLARVCVVDLQRVYQECLPESRAVRDFNNRSKAVQDEIIRRQNAINELKVKLEDARISDNQTQITRLESQINTQTISLNEYYNAQTAILDNLRKNLASSNTFFNQISDDIRRVAESEGFSIVLNKDNLNILWYHHQVDITDKLIQSIKDSSR